MQALNYLVVGFLGYLIIFGFNVSKIEYGNFQILLLFALADDLRTGYLKSSNIIIRINYYKLRKMIVF